jgi:hypothetical protein
MRRVCLALAVLSALEAAAHAEPPEAFSLTASGGVSLGAYQAGYLYFGTETVRRAKAAAPLRLITGASAGSINAFIAALSSCRPVGNEPDQSLFWQSWMDLGFRELFDPAHATAISIFTRAKMYELAGHMRAAWNRGLSEDCDVVLGISVTRLESEAILIHGALEVPHQEEKFALRIQGRGPGRPPRVTNYVDPRYHLPQPLLPLAEHTDDDAALAHNFDAIRDLLFASAAFPIAFAPQQLSYCMSKPSSISCPKGDRHDDFIDGGVFDNRPLGLAVRLSTFGLRRNREGHVGWRDPNVDDDAVLPPGAVRYAYLDPDNTAYPNPIMADPKRAPLAPKLLLPTVARLAEAFVATSRGKELYTLAQSNAALPEQMELTRRYFPTASGQLLNFLGFFEREFRRYDFYLGMYDAYKAFADPKSPLPTWLPWSAGASGREIGGSWRPFACMVGTFENRPELLSACEGDDLRDFRILLMVSLARLYTACTEAPPTDLSHAHCSRAAAGETPPQVAGVKPVADWRRHQKEADLDYVLRLLAAYEFEYRDIGLAPDEAHFGAVRLRRKLIKMVNTLADLQPDFGDSVLLKSAGHAFANSLVYEPPRSWAYVVVGSFAEIGASVLPWDWNRSWARLNLALDLDGLSTVLSDTDKRVSLTPAAGPEFELLFLSNQWLQPTLGVRGGYHWDSRDNFGSEACTLARSKGDARSCSGFVLQGYAALGIYERVRIQVVDTYQFVSTAFDDRHFTVNLGIGFQFF